MTIESGRCWPLGGRIVTPRTVLVPLSVDDADGMAEVLAAPELYSFIGGGPPSVDELRIRFARQVVGHSSDGTQNWYNWIIHAEPDGLAIGTVQATVTDKGSTADIAWVVGAAWQGEGYATEAAVGLVEALRDSGIRCITAHVHPDHLASAAVARAAGLTVTDVLYDGERRWELVIDR